MSATLVDVLAELGGKTVVGVHGKNFLPPYRSYVTDSLCFDFTGERLNNSVVHELGTGTCAFLTSVLNFDVTEWPYNDANDICFAIEARKRSIPMICIKRQAGWLLAYADGQIDSLWTRTQSDDRRHSDLMRTLMKYVLIRDVFNINLRNRRRMNTESGVNGDNVFFNRNGTQRQARRHRARLCRPASCRGIREGPRCRRLRHQSRLGLTRSDAVTTSTLEVSDEELRAARSLRFTDELCRSCRSQCLYRHRADADRRP